MDSDARLRALARLAQSKTAAARVALESEIDRVANTLENESEYDLLEQSLEILDVIGYRFSERAVAMLREFILGIESRKLLHSRSENLLAAQYVERYNNARTLVSKAIELLVHLRYYETSAVLRILLDVSNHPDPRIRKTISNGLEALSKYDLDVFYGPDRQGGLGARPQLDIIEVLEAEKTSELSAHYAGALQLLTGLLSPSIEGASWSSKAVTLSRGQTPAIPEVLDIRARSIRLLRRLYALAATNAEKISTINVLNGATRTELRGQMDGQMSELIARDSVDVLCFYRELVPIEDLQILQKIEHNSYWIFVHAHREDIKAAAREVERAIAIHREYQIYRTLVGFEGIFGDWGTLSSNDGQWGVKEDERRRQASEFARSINQENYPAWQARILTYAKTESDDLATFPIFYQFLDEFAASQPTLALKLLKEHTKQVARFIIPLLHGLWGGPYRHAIRKIIDHWIGQAQPGSDHHLFASTKLFLSTKEVDVDLLERLLDKAIQINDVATIRQYVAVATVRFSASGSQADRLKKSFLQALDVLTQQKDARWINEAWYRGEAKRLLTELDTDSLRHVLDNLRTLSKIEFHAEELLAVIAQREPEMVIQFFCERIAGEDVGGRRAPAEFEAVPFQFHKLREPLAQIPEVAIRAVFGVFVADRTLFGFRGARLLVNIFPGFPPEFETELLRFVREGGELRYEFVLGILRNYHGEPFVHRLCKEILKAIPTDSPLRTEVAIALETTGVVSGEFGMAEAYERKRLEVLDWLNDSDERVQKFAKTYIEDLERMRDGERKRAEEDIALRKFRYDEE